MTVYLNDTKSNDALTRGIKHWGLIGYLNILPRIKFSVTRQESSPQSPTFYTAKPLAPSCKKKQK